MPLTLLRQDIIRMDVDAIVNAANTMLEPGGGVCGAIFAAAGANQMRRACAQIGRCETGQAVITPGFALHARYVIHTAGPVWQGGTQDEAQLLAACYANSLRLAYEQGLRSIAFPLISSGIYGYPRRAALDTALDAIRSFPELDDMQVYLTLFDRGSYLLGREQTAAIAAYIDDNYVDASPFNRAGRNDALDAYSRSAVSAPAPQSASDEFSEFSLACDNDAECAVTDASGPLEELLSHVGEGFSVRLFALIDASGMTDPQVYRRANLDRKLFAKIRANPDYHPSKNTALALCVALKLEYAQAEDLLRRAGYAFSPGSKRDIIVKYYLHLGGADIYTVNQALFQFEQETLGAQ